MSPINAIDDVEDHRNATIPMVNLTGKFIIVCKYFSKIDANKTGNRQYPKTHRDWHKLLKSFNSYLHFGTK